MRRRVALQGSDDAAEKRGPTFRYVAVREVLAVYAGQLPTCPASPRPAHTCAAISPLRNIDVTCIEQKEPPMAPHEQSLGAVDVPTGLDPMW